MRRCFRLTSSFLIVLIMSGVAGTAGEWTLGGGPVVRLGLRVEARGSSRVQDLHLHAAQPGHSSPSGLGAGDGAWTYDISGYGDRTYDDGFVNLDPGTADPNSIEPGLTWYWGYQSDEQFDGNARTLTFHSQVSDEDIGYGESISLQTLRDDPVSASEDMTAAGIGLTASYATGRRNGLDWSFCVGTKILRGCVDGLRVSPYEETVQQDRYQVVETFTYDEIYTYDTGDTVPPPAPYEGTYNGPGPVIPNTPSGRAQSSALSSSRRRAASSTSWSAANEIDFDVESAVYDLWIGPRVGLAAGPRVSLYAIPSVSLNYIEANVDRTEKFTATYSDGGRELLQAWRDS